jgi:hypothetical protein
MAQWRAEEQWVNDNARVKLLSAKRNDPRSVGGTLVEVTVIGAVHG